MSINNRISFVPLKREDIEECLMSLEEFKQDEDHDMITPDDGDGYYTYEGFRSNISCFSERPTWATSVVWYNK